MELAVDINVLRQLRQNLLDILLRCEHKDELQFRDFDVYRVVVFTEEDADIVAQHFRPPLQNEESVP